MNAPSEPEETHGPIGRGLPRWIEIPLAALGLAAGSPLLIAAAVAVLSSSPGPILFRQERVGRAGRPFTLLKFRSMAESPGGAAVTAADDPRITAVGRRLRAAKIDELPQLWNILVGDMSFVGPRPEVPPYVDLADPLWRAVLAARPGLTDPTTLDLGNEEALIASVPGDRETFYRKVLLPRKLRGSLDYLRQRTPGTDLAIILRTLWTVVTPAGNPAAGPSPDDPDRPEVG